MFLYSNADQLFACPETTDALTMGLLTSCPSRTCISPRTSQRLPPRHYLLSLTPDSIFRFPVLDPTATLNLSSTMAEVAAGAWVAAEVVEHTAEAGYAAYLVSKPTLPIKVAFTRIATATGDPSAYVL